MTEFDYNKHEEQMDAKIEHRLLCCRECENCIKVPFAQKRICAHQGHDYEGHDIGEIATLARHGYCDMGNEDDFNDITPKADNKRYCEALIIKHKYQEYENKARKNGFYVEDLNAYVNDVNNFCYRVIAISKGGLVTTSDKLIMADMAKKLIKQGKKGE